MVWLERWRRVRRIAVAGGLVFALTAREPDPTIAAGAHLVRPGETLSEIAELYGVSPRALAAANGIADQDLIFVGDTLAIPGGAAVSQSPASAIPSVSTAYRVREGDTLEGIAAEFGAGTGRILAANPEIADPDLIFAGQVLRIPGASGAAGGMRVAVRPPNRQVAALLADYARAYGLDPYLVQALAGQESGWQQNVVSPAGAIGVMQVLPETGAWVAADIVGEPLDIAGSTADNVQAGVALLSWLADRSATTEMALINYVQGQGSVARNGVFPETRAYVANVLALRAYIAANGGPPQP
jgi:soluble lytic murein transglycosylase-like protein